MYILPAGRRLRDSRSNAPTSGDSTCRVVPKAWLSALPLLRASRSPSHSLPPTGGKKRVGKKASSLLWRDGYFLETQNLRTSPLRVFVATAHLFSLHLQKIANASDEGSSPAGQAFAPRVVRGSFRIRILCCFSTARPQDCFAPRELQL